MASIYTVIIFGFTSSVALPFTIGAIINTVLAMIYQRIQGALIGCCVARGNRIFRPKALITLDLLLSTTLGAWSGLFSGAVRFGLGVFVLLFRMTLLSRPVVPQRVGSLDSGFAAYNGMLKASFAAELDQTSSSG